MILKSDELLKKIGERFNLFRRLMNKSLEELAQELKTTVQDLEDIENGKKEDVLSGIGDLAELYGVDFNWLIAGEGSAFFTRSTKVEQKLYELVQLLPMIAEVDKTYTFQLFVEEMSDPVKKLALYRLYGKFNQRVLEAFGQKVQPESTVEH